MLQNEITTKEDLTPIIEKLERIEKSIRAPSAMEVFSEKETCEILKCARSTLKRYRERGVISYSHIGGRIYYTRKYLEKFLEDNRIEVGAEVQPKVNAL